MKDRTLREYIAENASLPQDVVLGHIVWFEVADGAYSGPDLAASFDRHQLNPEFLPPAINPADAFEKASKSVEGLKYQVRLPNNTNGRAEVLVREAARTPQQITRHLIREIRDDSRRRLSHDKVGEFVYYRPKTDGNGRVDPGSARVRSSLDPMLMEAERTLLAGMVDQFDSLYTQFRNFHDGQKLRAVLRNYLLHLNGVLMKSSVYFVHVNRAEELHRLRAFVDEFDGLNLVMWQIPDLAEHRAEVIEAFQREAEKELANVVAEIQKVRSTRKGKINPAQFLRCKELYDSVVARAGEHSRTLDLAQVRTSAASELALEALLRLRADVLDAEEKAS